MSTYLKGQPNLANLFSVFDFYLSVDIKPIFELSFMPSDLALDSTKTIMHYRGIVSTFKDAARWTSFIAGILTALEERYGPEEVRRWRFEVWNEPQGFSPGYPGFFYPGPG